MEINAFLLSLSDDYFDTCHGATQRRGGFYYQDTWVLGLCGHVAFILNIKCLFADGIRAMLVPYFGCTPSI
jgi:hypothetical protein